ncbi:putative serine-threonine protein kinase [Aspergillus sclerotiicarbonarius CBS 121057]|uniref:Putative serine-threonine protein kinase n=1 Tax=Aspergillus sclerotiicarbonarius (strain CBS 121057 / IBT 28362) TaxID=1448318 RepID=A0A319F7D7_ASPSB|nr:putative serine-threonine protein kinase [Aspergillus sclerotiicarbonarius CBS 121057]
MSSMSEIVPPQVVAVGSVSSIHTFGSDHVIKRCPPASNEFARQAFDIEVRAYERLGNHGRIAVVSNVTSEGIVLERGECLRKKIQSLESGKIPLRTRLRWAQEASEGLCYIHSKGIIHADVGCHNLLLDQSGHIRFIDFAGSGIYDEPPLVCYEWCASRGDSATTEKTDIFAFGSTLFEIESGHVPYHELCETMEIFQALRAAEQRFATRECPNMENLLFRHVITQCWDGSYSCMSEVEKDLRGLGGVDGDDNQSPAWEIAS